MPLFKTKFSPSKPTSRKKPTFRSDTDGAPVDKEPLTLLLGNCQSVFTDGKWTQSCEIGKKRKEKESETLKLTVNQLEEENNLLHLKLEILVDMLTEVTVESQMKDKEICRLRNELITLKNQE